MKHNWQTCIRHGWDCLNSPCPYCVKGDSPKRCEKHGWWSATPCPDCIAGKPQLNWKIQ